MSRIIKRIFPLRFCLLLALLSGSTGVSAEDGRATAAASNETVYTRLNSSSLYERRKALDELMEVAPDESGTVEVLIRQFQSQDAEEARFSDFIQRVERALQSTASKTTWSSANVELLTSVLVHNDAYDARATNRTASTVAGVARFQVFSRKAINDLTTVLWHRVDKNPNRTRGDNTRDFVVQALTHISKRQGLPVAVIDECVTSLGSEGNASVRGKMVLLLDAVARSQPASEAMVQALSKRLFNDDKATVRVLAARALRGISVQRNHPRSIINYLQQAAAGDPDLVVRREALAGLMAAVAVHPLSTEVLTPEAMEQLLRAAVGDPDAKMRMQLFLALGKVYATRAMSPATLAVLLDRLGAEDDGKVRGRIAVILQELHARAGLDAAVMAPLIPLVTDDPEAEVRRAISQMFVEPPAGQDLAGWMTATAAAGLTPTDAATRIALPDRPAQLQRVAQPALRAQLRGQYVSALSGDRAPVVRSEILQGLFALSLADPLPPPVVAVLAQRLASDTDAGVRLEVAAVLLHNSMQHHRDSGPFYTALDDSDARVHTYAAFAVTELGNIDGDVMTGLLTQARDPSAHRHLRSYSLRRLALWRASGNDLPASLQADLLALTGEPDTELRAEVWNALGQFNLAEQDLHKATEDEDVGIRRMAWWKLEALGVAKPVWAKWRDPKQRLQLIAVGLLGATLLAVVAGAVFFFWRLLGWLGGARQQRGKLLAAQLLWLLAALLTVALDGGIVFIVALSHVGFSEKDLMQLIGVFSVILASYVVVTYLSWKLLPARASVAS